MAVKPSKPGHYFSEDFIEKVKKTQSVVPDSTSGYIIYCNKKFPKVECIEITKPVKKYVPKRALFLNEANELQEILDCKILILTGRQQDYFVGYNITETLTFIKAKKQVINLQTPHCQYIVADPRLSLLYYLANEIGISIYFESVEAIKACGIKEDYYSSLFYFEDSPFKAHNTPVDFEKFENLLTKAERKKDIYGGSSKTFLKTEGKRYTFGVELETIRGLIPHYVRPKYNMCAKFDGSLRLPEDNKAHGAEYITGVLQGDAGFIHLNAIVSEIAKRCWINKQCSVHVHIGSLDFTQEFIVNMYKLGMLLEKELFSIMPASRRKNEYCNAIKPINIQLHYNKASYEIEIREYFEEIRKIINVVERNDDYKISKKKDHPLGHCCGYKRDTPRYWWLNFVPMMYNIRGDESYTIEYRLHSATLNYKKIEMWILICMGITSFVENHKTKIQSGITLSEIMKIVYPKSYIKINKYINDRKELFAAKNSDSENQEYSDNVNKQNTKKHLITDVYNNV